MEMKMNHHPHHMHHNPALHWGYSAAVPTHPTHNTWVPPSHNTRSGTKRSISESDCEDAYSEASSKDTSPKGDADSCQHLSRKKRRGVIEKKRRDRINSSLSELKRLVPSAFEKQGSAKLEKAEILQLTVDHLKTINSKGDSLAYDPQRFAMDYHIIGFRECAAEVARYLVNHEGMDIQDPLRMRLMSHLQCFVAQREISAKTPSTASVSPGWSTSAATTTYHHPLTHHQSGYVTATAAHAYQQHNYNGGSGAAQQLVPTTNGNYNSSSTISSSYVPNLPSAISASPVVPVNADSSTSSTTVQPDGSLLTDHSQQQQVHQLQQHHYSTHHDSTHHEQNNDNGGSSTNNGGPTYTDLSSSIQRYASASVGYGNAHYPPTGAQGYGISAVVSASSSTAPYGSKPYRPWGAGSEIAY